MGYLNARERFVSASLIFNSAALEGISNRGGYLPDFTAYKEEWNTTQRENIELTKLVFSFFPEHGHFSNLF